ncbi:YybH family protein [Burkholderia plantarii]|uniref:SnoaL-like domain-containing protein n=1 Tax=Burkholderia plantarii TaxID=41899 RepID=A0A0B6RUG2_BURPL|nr:nuclear transport factor 2 family protein [Burkholderia plantarii]AJK48972.1 hypothetical protein, NTF2-like superfamily [Burkholderia plantarii]
MNPTGQQVMAADDALIDAFGRHDRTACFAAFAPEATFVLRHVAVPPGSRGAYERRWREWERDDGFAVHACESRERAVQLAGGDTAIFTHAVRTTVRMQAGEVCLDERETIMCARRGERWLAIHEHLSPLPAATDGV